MDILLAAIFFCISSTQNLALIEIPEYVTCASFNNLATEPANIKGSFCKRHMRYFCSETVFDDDELEAEYRSLFCDVEQLVHTRTPRSQSILESLKKSLTYQLNFTTRI